MTRLRQIPVIKALVWRLSPVLGVIIAFVSLALTLNLQDASLISVEAALFTIMGILLLLELWKEAKEVLEKLPHFMESDGQIRDYLYEWIDNGGRVAIFSHDLSWAQNDNDMRRLLRKKAEANELSVYVPKPLPLTEQLSQEGANCYVYPELSYIPSARFTIIHESRMDSKVAIGRKVKGVHLVEEYSLGEHPVFALATDLLEVVRRLNSTEEAVR